MENVSPERASSSRWAPAPSEQSTFRNASGRSVSAVAGLGRGAGAEADELLGTHQLVDGVGVEIGGVEVVVALTPLVADVPELLELRGSTHGPRLGEATG